MGYGSFSVAGSSSALGCAAITLASHSFVFATDVAAISMI